MSDLYMFGVLIALFGIIFAIIGLLFRSFRRKAKFIGAGSLVLLVASFIGFSSALDSIAEKKGFESHSDLKAAEAAGMNAEQWRAEKAKRDAEKKAKEAEQEAERKREAERKEAAARALAERRRPPPDEVRFIEIVQMGQKEYQQAETDFLRGAARPARGKALCAAMPRGTVKDWVGTVGTLSTNTDGKGVIRIRLADDISVGTWNNAFSDIRDKTLIEPDTEVFRQLGELRVGDIVRFSGRFLPGEVDCYREASVTLGGSMRTPIYIMRFSSITPIR